MKDEGYLKALFHNEKYNCYYHSLLISLIIVRSRMMTVTRSKDVCTLYMLNGFFETACIVPGLIIYTWLVGSYAVGLVRGKQVPQYATLLQVRRVLVPGLSLG